MNVPIPALFYPPGTPDPPDIAGITGAQLYHLSDAQAAIYLNEQIVGMCLAPIQI